jgi:hypothetical protein
MRVGPAEVSEFTFSSLQMNKLNNGLKYYIIASKTYTHWFFLSLAFYSAL